MARLTAEIRRNLIVSTGVKLANTRGLFAFTYADIATACDVETSRRTVAQYYSTRISLLREIAEHADANESVKTEWENSNTN